MVLFFIPFFRVAPDGWKGVEFMILEFIGRVLKAMVWLVLFLLRCVLELAKMTLLVFGLVARVFLVFVKVAVD
jgi:hypothetical protein